MCYRLFSIELIDCTVLARGLPSALKSCTINRWNCKINDTVMFCIS